MRFLATMAALVTFLMVVMIVHEVILPLVLGYRTWPTVRRWKLRGQFAKAKDEQEIATLQEELVAIQTKKREQTCTTTQGEQCDLEDGSPPSSPSSLRSVE